MKRFRWITGLSGWGVGVVGTGLAVIAAAQEYLGLRLVNALLILVVVAVAVLSLVLSAIGKDIDEDLDQLQADVNDGFERVVDVLGGESGDVRTDGGSETTASSRSQERLASGPTGGGALGGMVAGGAVGSAFGPGGVIVGGVVGGLLGNEFEYRNHRRKPDDDTAH